MQETTSNDEAAHTLLRVLSEKLYERYRTVLPADPNQAAAQILAWLTARDQDFSDLERKVKDLESELRNLEGAIKALERR